MEQQGHQATNTGGQQNPEGDSNNVFVCTQVAPPA